MAFLWKQYGCWNEMRLIPHFLITPKVASAVWTWLLYSTGPGPGFLPVLAQARSSSNASPVSCGVKAQCPGPWCTLLLSLQLALLLHNVFVFPDNRQVKQLVVKCVHQNNRLVNIAGSVVRTKKRSWIYCGRKTLSMWTVPVFRASNE